MENNEIKYEFRKSIGGWSVDKKQYGSWMFYMKFSTKKAAQNFVNNKLQEEIK